MTGGTASERTDRPAASVSRVEELTAEEALQQRWRIVRIAIAAGLLALVVLVAGIVPIGHVEESWPPAARMLDGLPYFALLLLGVILTFAVDDLEAACSG